MDLAVFTPYELSTALGALRALAPQPNEVQERFIRIIATMHGVVVDPRMLPAPTPDQTATVITDPQHRKCLLQLAVVSILLANAWTSRAERAVTELAAALNVDDAAIKARLSGRRSDARGLPARA